MSTVIIDNWTLVTAFSQLLKNTGYYQDDELRTSVVNLLTGIILWDEIRWTPNSHTTSQIGFLPKKEADRLKVLCSPIHSIMFREFEPISKYFEDEHDYYSWFDENANSLFDRTKMYQNLSFELGLNYFPHPNRSKIISIQPLNKCQKNCNRNYDRRELLQIIDKSLKEYYDEILGNNLYFYYPVLYDFIRRESGSPLEELAVTLCLRDDKNVVELRQGLNMLDQALNKGDRPFTVAALKQINELSRIIANDYSKANVKIETKPIKLGFTLPIVGGGVYGEFSVKRKIKPDTPKKFYEGDKILNLTFLTELYDFGIGKKRK